MDTFKKHWVWIVAAVLLGWWLVSGGIPVVDLLAHLVGRGRQLTHQTFDSDGNIVESAEQLAAQAAAVVGRDVSTDAIYLAKVSASEHPVAPQREKAAIQRVAMNDAAAHGWSLRFTTTAGNGFGHQGDENRRRYASAKDIWEQDLLIAEGNLANAIPDETEGSTHFVHITGFATLGKYQALCAQWKEDMGIVPVALPGIPSFRIFLKESDVTANG